MQGITILGNRVLVEKAAKVVKSAGGIILSASAQVETHRATVVAIGHTTESIKVGDLIIMEKFCGGDLIFEGKAYVLLKSEDIVAVVNG